MAETRRLKDDPSNYKGPRNPILTKQCGFCSTSDHNKCAQEIAFFEKLWVCGCECNVATWKYYEGKEQVTDDMRAMRVPGKAGQHAETDDPRPNVQEHAGPGEGEASVEDGSDNSDSEVEEIGDALPGEDSEAA